MVIPRHKRVDFTAWPTVGDALEGLGKAGIRIDVVHSCRLQQRSDRRPASSAAVAAGKQRVLSRYGLGPDCPFNDVRVELDAAIAQEALKDGAARGRIADRLGELRFSGYPWQGLVPEIEELRDNYGAGLLTHRDAGVGTLTSSGLLDLLGRKLIN